MKCFDPKLCYVNGSGKRILRHFSMASPVVIRAATQIFNCGTCGYCRRARALELACRCVLHASCYVSNCFLTLTYDESREGYHNRFQYEDIQKFKKRLRAHVWRKYGRKIEVFNVHEYGKNQKKHWHLIVFNYDFGDKSVHTIRNGLPLYTSESLEKLWSFGFCSIGDVSEASAMYQAQYVQKDVKNGNLKSIRKSHSKHAGIGKPFFLKHYRQILMNGFVPFSGKKVPLPRYFDKLAHKHYAHFFEPSLFFDNSERKARYRPFKNGEESREIALLYSEYLKVRDARIAEFSSQWEEVLERYVDGIKPDFIQAGKNWLHDLQNRNYLQEF